MLEKVKALVFVSLGDEYDQDATIKCHLYETSRRMLSEVNSKYSDIYEESPVVKDIPEKVIDEIRKQNQEKMLIVEEEKPNVVFDCNFIADCLRPRNISYNTKNVLYEEEIYFKDLIEDYIHNLSSTNIGDPNVIELEETLGKDVNDYIMSTYNDIIKVTIARFNRETKLIISLQ